MTTVGLRIGNRARPTDNKIERSKGAEHKKKEQKTGEKRKNAERGKKKEEWRGGEKNEKGHAWKNNRNEYVFDRKRDISYYRNIPGAVVLQTGRIALRKP